MTDNEKSAIAYCLARVLYYFGRKEYDAARKGCADLQRYMIGEPMAYDYFNDILSGDKAQHQQKECTKTESDYIDCDDAPVRIYLPTHNKK